MVARLATLLVIVATLLAAATMKLYLKGGGDLIVTEYSVEGDRVRYYSAERRQWEQIPAELVDLERTEKASERTRARLESMRAASATERKAERKARTELHNVPIEEGIYYYSNDVATEAPQQEVIIEGVKKRKLLQVISPIPMIAGKKKLYVEGEQADLMVKETKPVFYVRQSDLTLFGMVKATVEKKRRVMQVIQTVPKVDEMYEEQEEIEDLPAAARRRTSIASGPCNRSSRGNTRSWITVRARPTSGSGRSAFRLMRRRQNLLHEDHGELGAVARGRRGGRLLGLQLRRGRRGSDGRSPARRRCGVPHDERPHRSRGTLRRLRRDDRTRVADVGTRGG